MPDTQWSRYQVFLQDKPGTPYLDMGSIHAPDNEIALLNARDVFVRRPACISLWVTPVSAIYSKTTLELQKNDHVTEGGENLPSKNETYYVFGKSKPSGTQTYLGAVEAAGPAQALNTAVTTLPSGKSVIVWWVFAARLVVTSDPADADSFFEPALNKAFRLSTDFHTVSAMRQIKSRKNETISQSEKEARHAD